jgi:hypothetical protein
MTFESGALFGRRFFIYGGKSGRLLAGEIGSPKQWSAARVRVISTGFREH